MGLLMEIYMTIYTLHMTSELQPHTFREHFSSIENINIFLHAHPEVTKELITLSTLDPQ
jgi:hypothetical protein